jgi:hypothetical protein
MDDDVGEKHKLNRDGLLADGVSSYPATEQDLVGYQAASSDLSMMKSPVLFDSKSPDSRLFVANFDGTGNDAINDPAHATNVARINSGIEAVSQSTGGAVASGYVAGPGTQEGWLARTVDGAKGHTYDERLEEMYRVFIAQAWEWKRDNPDAEISLAVTGFSRGAEQAAGFTRLVHERGIQNPEGAVYTRDADGMIKGVTYTQPPLVEPGKTAQAVALFDPVGTGEPVKEKDRRLPPSVISGIQITAEDEVRGLFKSTRIIDPGMTEDGRFLGVTVAGAHSDIGGSYHRDGLAIRNGNFVVDYLNSLSDKPLLEKRAEPDDPRLNVVHRSEEGMLLYRMGSKVNRLEPGGYIERLVPQKGMEHIADPNNAEPRDEQLNAKFARQAVSIGPVPPLEVGRSGDPVAQQPAPNQPGHPDYALHQQIRQGVQRLDERHGRDYDATSERITASLLPVAKQAGLTHVDQVLLGEKGPRTTAGEMIFVVQGQQNDPAHRMGHMNTAQAATTPVEASFERLEQINRERVQIEVQQNQQRNREVAAPSMGM